MQKTVLIGALVMVAAGGFLWWKAYGFDIPAAPGGINVPAQASDLNTQVRVSGHIGEKLSGLGVGITPELVVEESRCPIDVQCIQAGTVRLKARLESGLGAAEQIFKLNEPVTTEAEIVTLVEVTPTPRSQHPIASNDYVFTFKVEKR